MGITVKSFPYPVHHYGKMDPNNDRQKDERYYKIGIDKLSASSKDPVAIREMAVQAAKLEKFEDSISLWKRFIEIEPEDPRSYINLASVYGKLKQYQKARDVAQIATRLAPDVKEAQLNLGLSELHLGNTSKAKEIFKKLVKSDHNYLSAVFLLGTAQICHGDIATGEKTLKRLKGLSIWDNLSYSLQEIVEGLIEADWPELARNLIKAADRLYCSNDTIKEYARHLEIEVTTKKTNITLSASQRTDNTRFNATVM
jgi:tetratricopeptide (TPR) repeat protein